MEKLAYLKRTKSLLNGIVKQRDWILKHDKSHIESDWCRTEMKNIEYAMPKLVDADRAKAYLERKETALRLLIPSTNQKRHNELRELVREPINTIRNMSATKEYYHDLIEGQCRQYDILELMKMNQLQLLEIAETLHNITVGDATGKQSLIYAILNEQDKNQ